MLHRVGSVVGEGAVRTLRFREVVEPFGVKSGRIGMISGGAGVDLGVARPSQPLVALRAVSRHLEEVRSLGPHHVLEEPVGHRVGRFKAAGARRIGVEDNAGNIVERGLAGIPGQFDVLEAMIGEARRVALARCIAAQDEGIGGARFAQVLRHQAPVRVDHFGVADPDGGPRGALAHALDLPPESEFDEISVE